MLLNGYQSGICNPHILEKCNCSLSSGAKNRDRNLNQFPPMSSQQEQRPFLGELSSRMTRCDSTVQKFPVCAEPCWVISASEPTSRFASALLHQPPPICTWSVWMKEYVWNQEICMFATFSSQGQRWQWGTWLFWYSPGSLGNASILFWLRDEVGRHFVPKRAWIFTLVKQKERWNYSWLSI